MPDGFHKLFRLKRIIKGKLTASDAAIHVVGGSGNKEAWFSRHGMPPMRGRDNPILLSRRHKSTMSQCDLWHPWHPWGRFDDAERLLLESYRAMEAARDRAPYRIGVLESLVELYEAIGKPDLAAEYRTRLELLEND